MSSISTQWAVDWMIRRSVPLTVAMSIAMGVFCLATAHADEPPPAQGEKSAKTSRQYVRVKVGDDGKSDALETIVLSFKPKTREPAELHVDLIGAVHVGESSYYEALNKRFDAYDVVLYELVAPEGTRIKREDAEKAPRSAIGGLQTGMQAMLGLQHQLQLIDYQKKNFVHADMSPEEFEKTMSERGESWSGMFFRAMGYGFAQQYKKQGGQPSEIDLLGALFSKNREYKLRNILAGQLQSMDGQLAAIGGEDGSTIIEKRNGKAFSVLRKQIDAGKKKIGVFYGAGHFGDMEKRLINDFAMEPTGEDWLPAWNLREPGTENKVAPPASKSRSRGRQRPAEAKE